MLHKRQNFKVELRGRAGLIYKEGQKVMHIDSELLAGQKYDIVIYADSINCWKVPFDSELVTDADRQRIKANIASGLRKMRVDWQ